MLALAACSGPATSEVAGSPPIASASPSDRRAAHQLDSHPYRVHRPRRSSQAPPICSAPSPPIPTAMRSCSQSGQAGLGELRRTDRHAVRALGVADVGSSGAIVISVSDGKSTASLQAFMITVSSVVNRAPRISGTPDTLVSSGS